jgi:hypothetical protein
MSLRILLRQPAVGVDAVEHIVRDIEGKPQPRVIILHPAAKREIRRARRRRELWRPAFRSLKKGRVCPLAL